MTPTPERRTTTEVSVPRLRLTLDVGGPPVDQVVYTAGRDGAPPRLTVTYNLDPDPTGIDADAAADLAARVRSLDPAQVRAGVEQNIQTMADDPYAVALGVVADLLGGS